MLILFSDSIAEDKSLFSVVRDQFCIQKIHIPPFDTKSKIVILRLDDVQAFSWRDISMQMILDAYTFNAPIVAGVIPKNIESDSLTMKFLKRENCNIEIAIHGWDHFGIKSNIPPLRYITEFGDISYSEARKRVRMAKDVLQPLSDKPIITFIPPFNVISIDALNGIFDEGIQVNSGLGTGRYDYRSATYNFDQKRIVNVSEILSNCEKVFESGGPCIIMMHPQDYAKPDKTLDRELYNKFYIEMLSSLAKMDVVFIRFSDLTKNTDGVVLL